MNWSQLTTQGRIDAIRSVWQPGMSAAQIASHFDGVSRNAVIGIYGRHGDKLLDVPLQRPMGRRKKKMRVPVRSIGSRSRLAPKLVAFGPPQTAGIPLMELNGHRCKWCVNDPAKGETHLFCGEVTKEGRPYCAFHATISVGQGTESERSADRAALHVSQQAA